MVSSKIYKTYGIIKGEITKNYINLIKLLLNISLHAILILRSYKPKIS